MTLSAHASAAPRWRLALYSVLPAALLFAAAETVVRIAGLEAPSVRNVGLPEERAGLVRLDPELFWALKPNLDLVVDGARLATNDLGLRSAALGRKQKNEFRILSLGESSTFGVGVGNDETYTAVLQEQLRAVAPTRHVTTINAAVSAYSSFQSLLYLEKRGLALQPDLVLVYHEVNDYLPSTVRDSSDNEIGALQTDRQLYESRVNVLRRVFVRSALFRFLSYRYAAWQLDRFRGRETRNPLPEVGLPARRLPARLRLQQRGAEVRLAAADEIALGRRVSEAERRDNLAAFVALCARHEVRLVLIHPSYRESVRHECLLTRIASETGTPMFEAFDVLHPVDLPSGALFFDSFHPTREGHRRLAAGLAGFLTARGLIPGARAGGSDPC